ncbi:probably inactive leucine-rich repeat receptor-like protein kinase At5g48380 [Lolium rigidum]|uniref:probably inactive leucine-rich repeat receptor-like protein kinase At5g48380 n=1 Tax=Lolium rigidum TaxID=89674 RepID=UPI001F5DD213|nr:probably inactive leucine-rich repeat receptor-like protein kinase At5g48380 [Lolium rigidum]
MATGNKSLLWLLLLSSSLLCFGSELDIQCLKSVQQSVIDPSGVLKSSWDFANSTNNFICQFSGVRCWYSGDGGNILASLSLSNLGLQGPFPQGLLNCSSITSLDLSSNNFSGPIPPDISRQMPNLMSLDLSYNSFSGSIPQNISNMNYLYTLNLEHNQLSGQIPPQFSLLTRLTTFSVADNLLSGPIPSMLQKFSASNFVGNQGLYEAPLDECSASGKRKGWIRIRLHRINDESSIGAAVGFVAGFVVAFYFPHRFICSERLRSYIVRIFIHGANEHFQQQY